MKITVDMETLISSVRERPPLWDPSQPADKIEVDKLWTEVAKNCKATMHAVKQKWYHIKMYYFVLCRGSKNISWKWYDQLSFLKPTLQEKQIKRKSIRKKNSKSVCLKDVSQADICETNSGTSFTSTATVSSCRCNVVVADVINQCKDPKQLVSVGVQTSGRHEEMPTCPSSTTPVSSVQCKCNASLANCNKPFEETLTSQEREKLELIRSLSKQDEDRDTTYHFLMSLKDPINSLTVREQLFVRLKFLEIVTHIIQNHCERQRSPSP